MDLRQSWLAQHQKQLVTKVNHCVLRNVERQHRECNITKIDLLNLTRFTKFSLIFSSHLKIPHLCMGY
jgi:hypothetical protein